MMLKHVCCNDVADEARRDAHQGMKQPLTQGGGRQDAQQQRRCSPSLSDAEIDGQQLLKLNRHLTHTSLSPHTHLTVLNCSPLLKCN